MMGLRDSELFDHMWSRYTTPACDIQTDGQMDRETDGLLYLRHA